MVRRLLTEALANAGSRPVLLTVSTLVIAVAATAAWTSEVNTIAAVDAYSHELHSIGYATLSIEHDDATDPLLSTDVCQSLGEIDGVLAAVAMRSPTNYRLAAPAGPNLLLGAANVDIIEFLHRLDATRLDTWAGAQLLIDENSSAASHRPGEYPIQVIADDGTTNGAQALTVSLTALGTGSSGLAIAIDNTPGPVDACYLLVSTPLRHRVVASVSAALPAHEQFTNRWVLPSADRFQTPHERFDERPSQWYWIAATAAGIALCAAQLRLRRADHALYAIGGLSRPKIAALTTAELLTPLWAGLAIATLALGISEHTSTTDRELWIGWVTLGRATIATTLAAAILAWTTAHTAVTRALDAVKDR